MIEQYLKQLRRKSDNTKELTKYALNRLRNWADTGLEELDEDDIEDFLHHLEDDGLKKSSINSYLSCIRSFYTYLKDNIEPGVEAGEIREALLKRQRYNRIIGITNLKPKTNRKTAIPKDDVKSILEEAYERKETLGAGHHYKAIAILSVFGLRRNELLGLKSKDIDYKTNHIYIPERLAKTPASERKIPIPPVADDLFDKTGFILGKRYSKSFANYLLNRYQDHTDEKLYPHRFRITFDTYLYEAGVEKYIIKRLMGHDTDTDMTDYYRGDSQKLEEDLLWAMCEKNYAVDILRGIVG